MPASSRRKANSAALKSFELALAVPQVVAHRTARMALAGPTLSTRDRKEFTRMVSEKNAAFAQAWIGMATQAMVAWQTLAASFFRSLCVPATPMNMMSKAAAQWQGAALGVWGKGLAPVHRAAVANSKRLARTSLR